MIIYVLMYNTKDDAVMSAYFARENAIRAVNKISEALTLNEFRPNENWVHKILDDPGYGYRSIFVCDSGPSKGESIVFSIKAVQVKDNPLEALAAQAE